MSIRTLPLDTTRLPREPGTDAVQARKRAVSDEKRLDNLEGMVRNFTARDLVVQILTRNLPVAITASTSCWPTLFERASVPKLEIT